MSINATGNAEILVSTTAANGMNEPNVTLLPAGGWIAVWSAFDESEFNQIFMQRFDAAGNPVGAEIPVGDPEVEHFNPTVVALADGGWIVTSDGGPIVQQRFDADGNTVGAETQVSTTGGDVRLVKSVALSDGGWVTTWQAGSGNEDVLQQRFDADGNAVGAETQVNTTTSGRHVFPDSVALPDGGWVVTWFVSDGNIFLQRFDANGDKVDGETRVNSTSAGTQQFSAVAALSDGGWVVTWESPDADQTGIFQQRYDSDGDAVGGETQVNTTSTSFQSDADVVALSDGGWVVTWQSFGQDGDSYGIYQQRYDSDGNAVGTETLVNVTTEGYQDSASVTALPNGGWIVSWVSEDPVTSKPVVHQRIFAADIEGTSGNDTLTGTAFNETLTGGDGDDRLNGGGGADRMEGGDGDDTYFVNHAGDVVVEEAGGGIDTVRTNLSHALAANVENVVLTGSGNINATGNGLDNTISGNAGKNSLNGAGGADRMIGGDGNDTYFVDDAGDVVVEAANGGTDTVRTNISHRLAANVENLVLTGSGNTEGIGNTANNAITGNDANNVLKGGAGNDVLTGGLGADIHFGGSGADRFVFKSVADSTVLAGGRDVIEDFSRSQGDKLDLSAIDANTRSSGNQAFTFLGEKTAFTGKAGELRYVNKSGDTFIYGDVNGDKSSDFAIQIDANIDLVKGDFIL